MKKFLMFLLLAGLIACSTSTPKVLSLYDPIPDGKYADWRKVVRQMAALSAMASRCAESNRVSGQNTEQFALFLTELSKYGFMPLKDSMAIVKTTSDFLMQPKVALMLIENSESDCPTAQLNFETALAHYSNVIKTPGDWRYK